MNYNVAMKSYAHAQVNAGVQDASSPRLISMLYEGLLTRIAQAKGAMQQKDIENKGRKITEAMNIIIGLHDNLDMEQGGDIATNLSGLYQYVLRCLILAHTENDEAKLEECRELLSPLAEAWKEIS